MSARLPPAKLARDEEVEKIKNIAMKKPKVRGPSPSAKAKQSLGQKLNRPPKPPPSPHNEPLPRRVPPSRPIKGD